MRQQQPSAGEIRRQLGNGIAAIDSVVTAIYLALAYRDAHFDALLSAAIALGGDVDTIAAMAGAIWGACRGEGALPVSHLELLEAAASLHVTAEALWRAAADDSTASRRYFGA